MLFAVWKTHQKDAPKEGVAFLKTELGDADYWARRTKLIEITRYLRAKTARTRPQEHEAADLLMQALEMGDRM